MKGVYLLDFTSWKTIWSVQFFAHYKRSFISFSQNFKGKSVYLFRHVRSKNWYFASKVAVTFQKLRKFAFFLAFETNKILLNKIKLIQLGCRLKLSTSKILQWYFKAAWIHCCSLKYKLNFSTYVLTLHQISCLMSYFISKTKRKLHHSWN